MNYDYDLLVHERDGTYLLICDKAKLIKS